MFGSILLAQLGQSALLQDISNLNINDKFTRLKKETLEFVVNDVLGNQVKFIPLFEIEEEEYTVYLDLTGKLNQNSQFSFAKDGSAAYEEKE